MSTDTSARPPVPPPTIPPAHRRGFWRRLFWHSYGREDPRDRHPYIWFARKYDAHIYGIVVALSVPLMGWLITSSTIKLWIALVWFAVTHAYWALELDEIRSQIRTYGILDVEESDYQRATMQYLNYGIIGAAVVWGFVLGIHITIFVLKVWSGSVGELLKFLVWSWYTTPLFYGWIEFFLLVHTRVIAKLTIKTIFPLITIIQQALANQLRRETPARND